MHYHGFDIEIIADEGKFKAVIRRADGGTLRTAVPTAGPNMSVIFTPSFPRKEEAAAEAKRAIDASVII